MRARSQLTTPECRHSLIDGHLIWGVISDKASTGKLENGAVAYYKWEEIKDTATDTLDELIYFLHVYSHMHMCKKNIPKMLFTKVVISGWWNYSYFPFLSFVFYTNTCIKSKSQCDAYASDDKEHPEIQKQKAKRNDNLVILTSSSAFLSMPFRTNLLQGSGLICKG